MANSEHLAMLKQGVEEWNLWRSNNRSVWPVLNKADLRTVGIPVQTSVGTE